MARGPRKRPTAGHTGQAWVWTPTATGWRRVRARVPSRSERVPRPPSPSGYVGGVAGAGPRPLDPDTFRRGLREIGELGEAIARAMLLPIELVRQIERKLGGLPTAALVGYVVVKHMGTTKKKKGRTDAD